MNLANLNLFIKDMGTGDIWELGEITQIEKCVSDEILLDPMWHEPDVITSLPMARGSFECSASINLQPKVKLRLFYGVSNNFLKMHGGKPLRRISKRFLK